MDLERLRRTEYNQQYIAAMRPVFNRRALFTDTSAEYVIPEEPEPYSEVTIRQDIPRKRWTEASHGTSGEQ